MPERHTKRADVRACTCLRSRTVNYREDRVLCGQCDHCQRHRNAAVSELTLSDPQLSPTSSTLYLLPTRLIVSPCRYSLHYFTYKMYPIDHFTIRS